MKSAEFEVRYYLNARDEVVAVNEAWDDHAQVNGGESLVGNQILGRSLWDFIADMTTRQLYQQIIARVRLGCHARFPLRCDTAWCKRLLEVSVRLMDDGLVEFSTSVSNMEIRPEVPLLTGATPGCKEVLRSCAWCCRIDPGSGIWTDVEKAASELQLFENSKIPQLSHGICPQCFLRMTSAIEGLHPGSPAANQDASDLWKAPD